MPNISLCEITKSFPGGVRAVDHISIDFYAGEIHAILGENGAGKSTLMHLLSGLYSPDSGTILINGKPHSFSSPRMALAAGIAMVHQHFMLIPQFTIAENIYLALQGNLHDRVQRQDLGETVQRLAVHYGIPIDAPNTPVSALSVGAQQRVEILKALAVSVKVLILDEPTAVLTPTEVKNLFSVLRRLKSDGYLILLITHKIPEVMAIADRLTVLRRSRLITTQKTDQCTPQDLATLMVGSQPPPQPPPSPSPSPRRTRVSSPTPLLVLTDLSTQPERTSIALHLLSLTLPPGEIIGIAGVDGNGQTELIETILGLRPLVAGEIQVCGQPLSRATPATVRACGVSLIPQDRRREGLALPLSVEENLLLNSHLLSTLAPKAYLTPRIVHQFATQKIADFSIHTASPSQTVSFLSGGNQQRVIIARELAPHPQIIIAANPTRGLDINATNYVHRTLADHCHRGAGVLLISTDLDEIFALSHRIYVLYQGKLLGPVNPQTGHVELGQMMTGVKTTS
ncbi:MAG: ABC transporter ATP-binding protein [Candidatus Binatia bacterium]